MLFGQVQAFIQVARTGNVSRAAEALYVTQPALTARIQALEKELGESALRPHRPRRATDRRRARVPAHRRARRPGRRRWPPGAHRPALGQRRATRAGRGARGRARTCLPPVLKRFANLHPRVDVAVRTGHSEEILAMVLNDEVQVGLVRTLRHPDIDAVPAVRGRAGAGVQYRSTASPAAARSSWPRSAANGWSCSTAPRATSS